MPAPCAPSSGRELYRSGGPDDPVAPPCRDQTNTRTDLAGFPVDPSCAAPADVRLKRTESRFASRLNRSFATQSGVKRTCGRDRRNDVTDPEQSLTPLEPSVSAPPDARCCSRPQAAFAGPTVGAALGADSLSRDYRSQVRNKVLGFSLSQRRG